MSDFAVRRRERAPVAARQLPPPRPLFCLAAVAAAALLPACALAQTATSSSFGFNYSACQVAGTSSYSVTRGNLVSLCMGLNGATRSLFTPTVDVFSDYAVIGSASAAAPLN